MEKALAEEVLKKLLTTEGGLDYKKYSLLRTLLEAHTKTPGVEGDPALLLNLFFPAEKVAQTIAEVVGERYLTFDDLENVLTRMTQGKVSNPFKVLKVIEGVIYVYSPKQDRFVAFTFLLNRKRVEVALSNVTGKIVKDLKLYVISATTYKRAFTRGKLLTPEELMENIRRVRVDNPEKAYEYAYLEILKQAAYRESSDVHFEVSDSFGVVRLRTAGALEPFLVIPNRDNFMTNLIANYVAMTRANLGSSLSPQTPRTADARDTIRLENGEEVNLRLAFAPIRTVKQTHFRLVIRLLRVSSNLMSSLDSLGLSEAEKQTLESAIKASNGMILTSGPTSSGKSTTLYGLLLNVDWDRKIITVEDPVEFSNPYLWTQHQVEKQHGLDFKAYLRIILREDPDVVLIGEIRDEETAKAMVEMANTGHLTFSTVHANTSVDVVKRLTDLGLPLKEVVEYGLVFMAQRLLRKSCPYCRYEGEVTPAEAEILGIEPGQKVMRNRGCEKCGGTGVRKERVLVMEVLPVMREIVKKMLLEGKSYREIYREIRKDGFTPMVDKALELNRKGEVSLEEILDKMRG